MRPAPGLARLRFILIAVLVSTAVASFGQSAGLELRIVEPPAGRAIFGPTRIRCAVEPGGLVERLELRLDDHTVGEILDPPWVLEVDVGQENREHRIEVVAFARDGEIGRAHLDLPALHIDEAVNLDLRQIYVTVSRQGVRQTDLRRQDFTLVDDGIEQELVTFESGEIPFTAILLLDGSASMQGEPLARALTAARSFVAGMRPLDEVQLLVASDRLLEVTRPVSQGEPLAAALDGTEATGVTALIDYLYVSLEAIERRQGRRVIVFLSDGFDGVSTLSMDEVLEIARRSRALLYWIRPRNEPQTVRTLTPDGQTTVTSQLILGPPHSAWRPVREAQRTLHLLSDAVTASGGRIVTVDDLAESHDALQEVLAELRQQYALGYYPKPQRRDGAWRKVEVRLSDRSLEARWRGGYYDR